MEGIWPIVTLSTKNFGDEIEIKVSGSAPGIPEAIKDKIFPPFFTNKEGTEGTGLGLSITHDIVKAHGGSFTTDSVVEFGAEFIGLLLFLKKWMRGNRILFSKSLPIAVRTREILD
jgi:signal transduction histidine kinase